MAAWKGGAWQNRSKGSAVPLTKLQSHVLRLLAAERSLDSYIAGGVWPSSPEISSAMLERYTNKKRNGSGSEPKP
jgi:hypothetical protein